MTNLAVATLQRLARHGKPKKNKPATVQPEGPPLSVQFNPTTLRISRNNNVDRAGATVKTQAVQNPSVESAKLTFDLEFDTAEQLSGGNPVDVRLWTALVRQFVEPPKNKSGEPAPGVQFAWGTLIFNGVVDQVTEELDYFAPDGTPLHAKVNVSITEQDFKYENQAGPAGRNDQSASEPGEQPPGTAPGSMGSADPNRIVAAQDNESAQQLLSRLGLDPTAWRGAMNGLQSPLNLAAGLNISLGAEVNAGGGLGVSAQFAADATVADVGSVINALGGAGETVAGSIGALASGSSGPTAGGSPTSGSSASGFSVSGPSGIGSSSTAGFTLSAAGGIETATRIVQSSLTGAATRAARSAFAVPPPRRSSSSTTDGTPGIVPPADRRALTYAAGVPLQTQAYVPSQTAISAAGGVSLSARARPTELPTAGPLTPPWVTPPDGDVRTETDTAQRNRDARPSTLRWRPGPRPGGQC
jgi:hypothetical protein